MSRRVRLVTKGVGKESVARAPVRQLPRTSATPGKPVRGTCDCGRTVTRLPNGKFPEHKNPTTRRWCASGVAPTKRSTAVGPRAGAVTSRAAVVPGAHTKATCACGRELVRDRDALFPPHKNPDKRWCPRGGTPATEDLSATAQPLDQEPWTRVAAGARCARCRQWFRAQDGSFVPNHTDLVGARCPGSLKRAMETSRPAARPRRKQTRSTPDPANSGRRPSSDLTPEQRREQERERKRRDRISMAMLELDDRPARDDLEFGAGRDPRVSGGLSQSRRSRY